MDADGRLQAVADVNIYEFSCIFLFLSFSVFFFESRSFSIHDSIFSLHRLFKEIPVERTPSCGFIRRTKVTPAVVSKHTITMKSIPWFVAHTGCLRFPAQERVPVVLTESASTGFIQRCPIIEPLRNGQRAPDKGREGAEKPRRSREGPRTRAEKEGRGGGGVGSRNRRCRWSVDPSNGFPCVAPFPPQFNNDPETQRRCLWLLSNVVKGDERGCV